MSGLFNLLAVLQINSAVKQQNSNFNNIVMITELYVEGLNNKITNSYKFNSDLNLFTGKNGSGKTTLLKLIWYLNSGHLFHLANEITFRHVELTTSNITIIATRRDPKLIQFKFDDFSLTMNFENLRYLDFRGPKAIRFINELRKRTVPTIFFPTFRRIEGGFSMEFHRESFNSITVKQAMSELSLKLTLPNQKFVASISTDDLISLLTYEYARITGKINNLQTQQFDFIIDKIKNRRESEADTLNSIQTNIEDTERIRLEFNKPFSILSDLIQKIFQYKGITLSTLTIGEVGNTIASEKLSAGEKQMLSFLCYNTFAKLSSIFIDEPELSLHPDWQRILVPTLLEQGNNNQFFMATHSPFIYAKYPDKEIILEEDKGDN